MTAAVLTGLLVAAVAWGSAARPSKRSGSSTRGRWLRQSGLDVEPGRFLVSSLGAAVAAFLLLLGLTGIVWVALPPAIAVGLTPTLFLARRRTQRLAASTAAWPDALRDLSASVASGMSLSRALEALVESGPEPIRQAMGVYPSLARTVGVVPALESVREQLADPIADRVVEVLRVAHERGGTAVPGLLADLAEATADDLRVDEEIRTESLEQRINARAVFLLPWFVLVVLCAKDGPFREFYASASGIPVIVAGALISGVGALIVGRLSRRDVEPRILGGRT